MNFKITSLSLIVIVPFLFLIINNHFFQPKIGYVKTGELLNKYKGIIAANIKFESEMKQVISNLDTLKKRYYSIKQNQSLKSKSPQQWGYLVASAEGDLTKYQQDADKQLQVRKQQLMSQSLDVVNKYIEQYGEAHNYKIILGATNEGSILYAKKDDDLTQEILKQLNDKYLTDSTSFIK